MNEENASLASSPGSPRGPNRAPAAPPVPSDCRRCGVCCCSTTETYVRVTGDDWARLGERAEELAHFIGHRAFMRMHDGHCAALEVRRAATGGAGAEDYFCTIYDRRPQICRDLARGSPECEGELVRKTNCRA